MIASSPPVSISRIQTSMLRRAASRAACSRPIWWTSEPQQPSPLGTTTSMPSRVSSRIAASLMPGSSTDCAQPVRIATRPRRVPGCGMDRRNGHCRFRRQSGGRKRQHRRERLQTRYPVQNSGERPAEPCQRQRRAKTPGMRQHPGQHGARSAGRAAAAGRSARYGRAHDRPDACSSRRTGRWSCRRGRTGSGRYG